MLNLNLRRQSVGAFAAAVLAAGVLATPATAQDKKEEKKEAPAATPVAPAAPAGPAASDASKPATAPVAAKATPAAPAPTPAGPQDALGVAASRFKEFHKLIVEAKLEGALKAEGPLTIIAPTDEAIGRIPKVRLEALKANPGQLKALLEYHIIEGKRLGRESVPPEGAKFKSKLGQDLSFSSTRGTLMVNGNGIASAQTATNGILFIVSEVLMPPGFAAADAAAPGLDKAAEAKKEAAAKKAEAKAKSEMQEAAPHDVPAQAVSAVEIAVSETDEAAKPTPTPGK